VNNRRVDAGNPSAAEVHADPVGRTMIQSGCQPLARRHGFHNFIAVSVAQPDGLGVRHDG